MTFKIQFGANKKKNEVETKQGIALVTSMFYKEISNDMVTLAIKTAHEHNIHIVKIFRVPGAYDIPLAVKKALQMDDVLGVVTLGAIIQGETAHDKIIGSSTAKTLQELSLEYNKPVTLGITGPGMDEEHAKARISRAKDATSACVEMIALLQNE